ncbi:MAG: PorT family protein [Fibrobacterota bacterium]|nr:PorT family protein [Fibrobacterota bacterium]
MTQPIRISLLLATFLAVCFTEIRAERKPVALGLVGGLTAASFWGGDVKEVDTELWPTTGFTLAFHLPVFLGLETDLLYVSKGGAIRTQEGGRTKVNTFKYHVLEIPFMLKITAPTGSEVMPIFFGGPSMGYAISKKSYSEFIEIGSGGTVMPEETPPLVKPENLSDIDWSLCLGAGVEWGLGSFQLRINLGRESLDETKQKDIKTVVLAVMAGFIF